MQIRRDWIIEFDKEQFIRAQGESFARLMSRPSVAEAWTGAVAEAHALVQPVAAWDVVSIREIRHEHLVLMNGTKIGGGPVTQVVGGATHLIVAVCTVGPAISERVADLRRQGAKLRDAQPVYGDVAAEITVADHGDRLGCNGRGRGQ